MDVFFSNLSLSKKPFVYFHKSWLIYLAYATWIHCQECIMERYHYLTPLKYDYLPATWRGRMPFLGKDQGLPLSGKRHMIPSEAE